MNRNDFLKLIGAGSKDDEYLPVACLLRDGRGCVGFYNTSLNEDLEATCLLVNARIIEFREARSVAGGGTMQDFSDFLEDVVSRLPENDEHQTLIPDGDQYGKAVPLTAIDLDEVDVLYPVSHISSLLERASREMSGTDVESTTSADSESPQLPTFLDFEQSPVLKVLRMKLW